MRPRLSVVIAGGQADRLRTTLASVEAALAAWRDEAEIITAVQASTHTAAALATGLNVALLATGDLVGRGYFRTLLGVLDEADDAPLVVRPKATVTYGARPQIRIRHGLESDAFRTAGLLFAAPFAPPLAARRALLASLPDRPWDAAADWRWTAETLAMGVRHVAVTGALHVAWSPTLAAEPAPAEPHFLFTGEAMPLEVTGRIPAWTPPRLPFAGKADLFGGALGDPAAGFPPSPPASGRDEGEAWDKPAYAAAVGVLTGLGLLPAVTAVLPNYNYARHLADRLRQIDGQTLPVSEIVVLDDASSDDSLEVVRAVAPTLRAPVRLIVNAANSGSAFRQWERGAKAARGELVWIAEADDVAEPEFLAALAPAFDDPRTAMAQSQSRQLGPDGEVVWADYSPYLAEVGAERWGKSFSADGRAHIAATLTTMNTIPNASAVLFRREVLLAVLAEEAGALAGYRLAGDWLVYLGLLARGRFYFCDRVLNGHRVHPASVTQSALTPLDRVLEVGRMQAQARARSAPSPKAIDAATAYLQKQYDWFGLAAPGREHVYDHPSFGALRPPPPPT